MLDEETTHSGPSQGFKAIIAIGVLMAVGLFTGATMSLMTGNHGIAMALAAAGVADLIAFAVLWRMDPSRVGDGKQGISSGQRNELVSHIDRLQAEGELDEAAAARAREALEAQRQD